MFWKREKEEKKKPHTQNSPKIPRLEHKRGGRAASLLPGLLGRCVERLSSEDTHVSVFLLLQ